MKSPTITVSARRTFWFARIGAAAVLALAAAGATAQAQTNNYFGTSGMLSGNVYSTNPAGPYTSAFNTLGGGILNFGNVATFTGGSLVVAGINATANATEGTAGGTISNFNNGVIPISVSSGVTLDFASQAFTTSSTAGYIKNGTGVLALTGGTFAGGFTLNAGTVILRGTNALGNGALTLNGGIVAGSASRDLSGKYNGITIGGDVQFGDVAGLALSSANLTFSNNMALGSAVRTLTLGNAGTVTFGGIIATTGTAGGLTFAATAGGTGRFDVTNTANTFTGPININGGEVRFTADGSFGNAANSITVDGGRLATLSGATYTLSAARNIFVGATAGTSISTPGAGVLTYNGVIADKASNTGILVKQGGGTLALGGVSTYTGDTSINNGPLQLTTGNNRLPTGTTVNIGQAASTNLGTFDLNGRNQQIAGLNSTAGTNASTTLKNTVTSTAAATLTLGGSGTYAYGDGTPANSGVITGTISIVKTGSGTQILGDANTYTGTTAVNGGVLNAGAVETANTSGPLGRLGTITFGGGTLQYSAFNNADYSSRFAPTAQPISIDTNGRTVSFGSALMSGTAGSLTLSDTATTKGTLTLNAANTFTGSTTVNGGALNVAVSTATGSVVVNTGGSLLLSGTGGANNKLTASTAPVVSLGGGLIDLRGITAGSLDQTVGALSLTTGSSIDFGALAARNSLRFAPSSSTFGTTSDILSIYNYTSGLDHLFFGDGNTTGLDGNQVTRIAFYSGEVGSTSNPFLGNGVFGGAGEVVPQMEEVPEPSTIAVTFGLLGLVGWRERKRFSRNRAETASPLAV